MTQWNAHRAVKPCRLPVLAQLQHYSLENGYWPRTFLSFIQILLCLTFMRQLSFWNCNIGMKTLYEIIFSKPVHGLQVLFEDDTPTLSLCLTFPPLLYKNQNIHLTNYPLLCPFAKTEHRLIRRSANNTPLSPYSLFPFFTLQWRIMMAKTANISLETYSLCLIHFNIDK